MSELPGASEKSKIGRGRSRRITRGIADANSDVAHHAPSPD
jgi:hypothetical protein